MATPRTETRERRTPSSKSTVRSAQTRTRRRRLAGLQVRRSPYHGLGVFTLRAIPAGRRVLEYTGERISHDEAADRYDDHTRPDAHVLLFTVDRTTVIDGAVGDGIARYVNHSCDPNCKAFIVGKRVFIESIRDIPAGAELTYDYRMTRPIPMPRDWARRYACRCGAPRCRGTMLGRPPRPLGRRPRARTR